MCKSQGSIQIWQVKLIAQPARETSCIVASGTLLQCSGGRSVAAHWRKELHQSVALMIE